MVLERRSKCLTYLQVNNLIIYLEVSVHIYNVRALKTFKKSVAIFIFENLVG